MTLLAGNALKIEGSDVIALQGDITGKAKSISITEVHDTTTAEQQTRFKQAGLTVAVSAPALSLLETANDLNKAAKQSGGDGRMQALAAGTAALNAYNSAGAMGQLADGLASGNPADMAKGANVSISATIGASKSSSQSTQSSSQAKGSSLQAGGDVSLIATGGGEDSNILIRGSDITAGKDVLLAADNNITLEAAQNTAEQHSSSKSSSWALGVAASYGSDGGAIGVTASASASRGNADGKDVTQRNTHVSAGNTATVISGGDTTLKGAQLSADRVVANVGGDLNIESLQDTSTYDSKNKSMGASVTVGAGFSGSASYSSSKVDGDYASVTEQSGIQTGAGGFDITVAGNTDLKGAVIASSQEAIDAGLNRLQTGTLTSSDIENHSQYSAKSVSLSGGYSVAGEGGGAESSPSTTNNGSNWSWQNYNTGAQGAAAGYGSEKGKESSTTASGISGGTVVITDQAGQQALTSKTAEEALAALNREVLTGDDANGLAKAWDGQKLQQQVEAQAQITAMFGQQASKAVGDYAQKQMELAAEKRQEAATATDPAERDALNALADQLNSQWGESGSLRVLAHTVIGGLTGGVGGAAGAAAGTLTAPKVAEVLREAGVTGPLADVLTGVASTAAGAAAGGVTGAAAGINEVSNNYLKHQQIADLQSELGRCNFDENCLDRVSKKYLDISRSNDVELAYSCAQSPTGSACQDGIREAMNYVGDKSWKSYTSMPLGIDREVALQSIYQLNGDVDSSRKLVLDLVFGDSQIYGAINDIDARSDFFGAMYSHTNAVWFEAAESQSRNNLSGAKFDAAMMVNRWLGAGEVMGEWRSAAGNRIMESGLANFRDIYYDSTLSPIGWSIKQLVNEQRDALLQGIHEKFVPKMAVGTKLGMEVVGGVKDVLSPDERVKTGCRNMGMEDSCDK
ncbi:hemagglutinin repeat-containing protein [Stenotrophomonas terrae]|uniref:hemagglutinin repeat-containing protein n=1 Tax=Stenotrophomonas terrae TaxID=405446 RepID=UPI003207D6DE